MFPSDRYVSIFPTCRYISMARKQLILAIALRDPEAYGVSDI